MDGMDSLSNWLRGGTDRPAKLYDPNKERIDEIITGIAICTLWAALIGTAAYLAIYT